MEYRTVEEIEAVIIELEEGKRETQSKEQYYVSQMGRDMAVSHLNNLYRGYQEAINRLTSMKNRLT